MIIYKKKEKAHLGLIRAEGNYPLFELQNVIAKKGLDNGVAKLVGNVMRER